MLPINVETFLLENATTGVPQKSKPQTFAYIVANYIDRFSQFFHRHILLKICNKVVTKYTISL